MTTTTDSRMLASMDTQHLLNRWEAEMGVENIARERRQRIEFELVQRMQADGATAIPHDSLVCELKAPSPSYDLGKLNGLRELLPDNVILTALTPAHTEIVQVPDRWDARVFKGWGKYGEAVAQVIKAALIPGPPRLQISRKEKKPISTPRASLNF